MGLPGFVVQPDGTKLFVQDKAAYFEQHPETYVSTMQAAAAHQRICDGFEAQNARQEEMTIAK